MAGLKRNDPTIDEARIAEVEAELRHGTEMKALAGSGTEALPHLKRAYDLSTKPRRLPSPLPEIAAYRLGHVIMREATTSAGLQQASKLFEEAAELPIDALGPLPRIYRVAVLYRLQQAAKSQSERRRLAVERVRLFQETCKEVEYQREQVSTGRNVAVEGSTLNYFELLAYCTGDDYFRIPRKISPLGDVVFDDEWVVIGTHGIGKRRIRYNRALAEVEFESRVKSGVVDLMFRADRPHPEESSHVWTPSSTPMPVSGAVARYLAMICIGRQRSKREQYRFVIGASDRPSREVKTVKQELKQVLRAIPALEGVEVLLRGKRGVLPPLNPEIRVAGIVHRKVVDEQD